ncbi:hypothetical protein [Micromonospora sp. NBRC 101691]|uniref:hypothetical protein n=1 Tax=Micromonospora sp. NBRC 101691 TaxID=3032198 RepID=UPI0024A096ED|nr:hypothetical protein [Micromonospora sp. NBRC 101691]GLY22665.1 hypothetical protein Misp04_23970 [Micromonospora sp. NBRC 101691]
MAVRGWGGTPATAFGIAAGTGAAQLGFGYGLGIISWTPPDPGAGGAPATLWAASLGWATWIAATSTIAGAVGAGRLARRPTAGAHARNRRRPGGVLSALAAALGALVTVLLVAVPARAAVLTDTTTPQTMAAAYTGAGLLVGFLVAIWAQRSPPAAANIFASIGWLWTLAVVAVVDGVLAGRGMASAQLGFWQPATDRPGILAGDHLSWLAVVLSLGSALVVGALAARRAARSTYRRVGAAASGAAGPLLVAVAYLLTVPRLPELRAEQLTAQFVAAYAVVTGIAGSVLVAALAQRRDAATSPASADATGATAADVATTDAVATIDATAVEVGTTSAEGVETSPVAGTALPADGATPGSSAPDAAEVDASATGAGAGAPADPAADAGPPRRRANRSTSRVPRQRREEPTTDAESGTGTTGPTDAPDGSVVEPGPAGPDDDSRTSPAAGAATEPRARGRRAAARRPRD